MNEKWVEFLIYANIDLDQEVVNIFSYHHSTANQFPLKIINEHRNKFVKIHDRDINKTFIFWNGERPLSGTHQVYKLEDNTLVTSLLHDVNVLDDFEEILTLNEQE